jgi:hypothetical protein
MVVEPIPISTGPAGHQRDPRLGIHGLFLDGDGLVELGLQGLANFFPKIQAKADPLALLVDEAERNRPFAKAHDHSTGLFNLFQNGLRPSPVGHDQHKDDSQPPPAILVNAPRMSFPPLSL